MTALETKVAKQIAANAAAVAMVLRILIDKNVIPFEEILDRLSAASDDVIAGPAGAEGALVFEALRHAIARNSPQSAKPTRRRDH